MIGTLISGFSTIHSSAAEVSSFDTEIIEEPSSWYLYTNNLYVSDYNGSLCVYAETRATEKMEVIGIKNVTVQYSYDCNNWYDEWNAGSFFNYDSSNYTLSNYIMALDRKGCYYRIACVHYAKKNFINTQSISNISNAVWIN